MYSLPDVSWVFTNSQFAPFSNSAVVGDIVAIEALVKFIPKGAKHFLCLEYKVSCPPLTLGSLSTS